MGTVLQITAAILLGILIRFWRGFSMLDPFFFIPFACLAAMLVGPAIAEMRRKHPGQPILVQVRKAVLRSCGSVALMLAVPLLILNYPWYETWLLPQWTTALNATVLSLTSTTAVAAATGLLVSRLSAKIVKGIFRVLMFVALIVYRFAPFNWGNAATITILDWGITQTTLTITAALLIVDAILIYLLINHRANSKSV